MDLSSTSPRVQNGVGQVVEPLRSFHKRQKTERSCEGNQQIGDVLDVPHLDKRVLFAIGGRGLQLSDERLDLVHRRLAQQFDEAIRLGDCLRAPHAARPLREDGEPAFREVNLQGVPAFECNRRLFGHNFCRSHHRVDFLLRHVWLDSFADFPGRSVLRRPTPSGGPANLKRLSGPIY